MPDRQQPEDPYYQLVLETTNAVVGMSRSIDEHEATMREVKALLLRIAAAEEVANQARQGRWTDVKAAIAALYANTILSGALTMALSMVAIGSALWVLTQLGVEVSQLAPWLGKETPP